MRAFWAGLGVSAILGFLAVLLRDQGREQLPRRTLDRSSGRLDDVSGRARATVGDAAGLVSLNNVSREELLGVYGIGPVLADRIIANRPYQNDYDVVERGIIPESGYKHLQSQLKARRAG